MEVVASLSQGRTAAAQCGLFTHKSVPVIFEPPCTKVISTRRILFTLNILVNMNIVIFKQEKALLFLIALLNLKRRFMIKTQCFVQTFGLIH